MGDDYQSGEPQSGEPQPGELSRSLREFRRDVRDDFAALMARMDQMVLREVYNVQRDALIARVKRVEAEVLAARTRAEEEAQAAQELASAEASSSKQAVKVAKLGSLGAFIASVCAALVSGWLSSKGGH